jgi:hypothetical protein
MLLAAPNVAIAQLGYSSWQLTGSAGVRFREERGQTLNGAALTAGFITPSAGELRWEFEAGISQLTAHRIEVVPPVGQVDSRETSFEAAALAEVTLARSGHWLLIGGVGPVASLSTGCTNEGTGAFSPGPREATCFNSFAVSGTTRIGGEVKLVSTWRGPRAAFEIGVSAAAHTVASGNTVSPALFIGLRAPLR